MRILIPDLDAVNSLPAVRHAARQYVSGERFEVHLLYLRSQEALPQARALLERFHIPYRVHTEAGDPAHPLGRPIGGTPDAIRAVARRIRADRILMGTARPWSATRLSEDAVIQRLLKNAPAPVSLVAGRRSVSRLERYGVAAGLGATVGLMLLG